ncbi:MAG: hypothetical protein IJD79_00630 [Clostridia bacterium]|nr:hypothetical protein [Clostridia bacterium]
MISRDDGGYSHIPGTDIVIKPTYKPTYSAITGNAPSNEQVQPIIPSSQNVNYSNLTDTGENKTEVALTGGEQKTEVSTGGSESPPTTTLPTYEEYINNLKTTAGTTRDRELIDARNAYEQNRATYGSTAAELSRLGLAGSGYSEYLDSQAYAGMLGDQHAAKVRYGDAIKNIDGMYASYLSQKESEKNATYANLLSDIDSFTASDIATLGAQYGFSEEQIQGLTDKRQNISYQALINGGYDKASLESALKSGDITQTHYDELLKDLQNPTGTITSESFVDSEGELISRDEAQSKIEELEENGVNSEIIDSAKETFSNIYDIKTNDVTYRKDGGKDRPGEAGNNFSVKSGKNTYHVQYSGKEVPQDVKNAALALTDGTVFMYQGKVYMKLDGEVYGVEKRTNSYAGEWKKLKEKLGG